MPVVPVVTLPSKQVTSPILPGTPATVNASQVHDDTQPDLLLYDVTAVCGLSSYNERHSVGNNGTGPVLALADLQKLVDGYRQSTADKAAWKENVRLLGPQVS
jgi:hypothetical protein